MIENWFECGIRYEKIMENGIKKKVTETYLIDALSFTEAEERIIKEMTPFISGEFEVSAIKRADYKEIVHSDDDKADKWYKVKINLITLDEKSGKENKTAYNVLVNSYSVEEANKQFNEFMKSSIVDYQIERIIETKIMDVYEHE